MGDGVVGVFGEGCFCLAKCFVRIARFKVSEAQSGVQFGEVGILRQNSRINFPSFGEALLCDEDHANYETYFGFAATGERASEFGGCVIELVRLDQAAGVAQVLKEFFV